MVLYVYLLAPYIALFYHDEVTSHMIFLHDDVAHHRLVCPFMILMLLSLHTCLQPKTKMLLISYSN